MIQVRTLNKLIIDSCSVAALEVMEDKSGSLLDYFGMFAGDPRVGKGDIVIFRSADGSLILDELEIGCLLARCDDLKMRHVFFSLYEDTRIFSLLSSHLDS